MCLIPSSAHGTNAASAVMAGMRVVVVGALDDGTVDLDDVRAKCEEHADDLAAIMVTYPSTHGVYEAGIVEMCEVVHRYGGQVYIDGANLNALLGLADPGRFGGDVSHLNLHKTFCIPHGGGGPGVGPVAVAEHLVPYLPSHPLHPRPEERTGIGPVSEAPFGSAGILAISWAYIRLLSGEGLAHATKSAVLAANYVAARLASSFPVLYTGKNGLVAHECILDVRPLTKATGVTVDDVAKRLIDYGFHAPTVSFPVAGTLMVEPTESEDLAELDRFCEAMISIRSEIDAVASGRWVLEDSPLRGAPHTASSLVGSWERPYGRDVAVFPSGRTEDKYWPPVAQDRPGLRRPQPGLLVPAARGLRHLRDHSRTSVTKGTTKGPMSLARRSGRVHHGNGDMCLDEITSGGAHGEDQGRGDRLSRPQACCGHRGVEAPGQSRQQRRLQTSARPRLRGLRGESQCRRGRGRHVLPRPHVGARWR